MFVAAKALAKEVADVFPKGKGVYRGYVGFVYVYTDV